MVTLNTPYLGYTRAELTGKLDGQRHELKLDSGRLIYLYEEEFIRD